MRRRFLAFGTSVLVLLLDRLSKIVVQRNVSEWDTIVIIPGFFNIVHSENRGAAFGMFAGSSVEWRGFFLIGLALVVTLFVASMLWQATGPANRAAGSPRWALALILGGAAGNLYDRLTQGTVTDFLQFFIGPFEWPSFNVADTAISIGAGLLVLDLLRHRRRPQGEGDAAQTL